MSHRAMTRTLWVLFVLTLPLPYFMIESGRVPAAQLFLFTALTVPLVITDPGFTTRFVASLFAAQSLLYGSLLYLLARAVARRLGHAVRPRYHLLIAAAIAAVFLAIACSVELYRAPLSHGPGRTTLLGVFF